MTYNKNFNPIINMSLKSERLEARVLPDVKKLVERVTAISGQSVSDYLTELILSDAPIKIKQHANISLSNKEFERFMAMTRVTVKPGKKLRDVAKALDNEGF
ncbi:type II toxin-antitoxin system TacA family antitoxin [Marinicella gelatinilytica]|uniref:type II toxin-antitoxin system TacA family antitoxin n=1 Tax=Marinicella gelatinilytica TaxID=2996017 RepID=UPI002260E447|nr:DUF1778 domain-containing protein [Marinicella gelatinilytica]MCX7544154.1 DUF1778 domain-containing protein [Marinicella gelatinilytica]